MITYPNNPAINNCLMCFILCGLSFTMTVVGAASDKNSESCQLHPFEGARFVKLDQHGNPLANQVGAYKTSPWSCVLDRRTQLVWEVKSHANDIHNRDNRYTWFNSQSTANGGFAGYPNQGLCQQSACDTQSFIQALNEQSYCRSKRWRLPNREELRSLVRYDIPYPGPVLERVYFPQALAQYYWTGSPASDDKDSAWGIGFSFGFDYAYFKSHAGYVRGVFSKQGGSKQEVSEQKVSRLNSQP